MAHARHLHLHVTPNAKRPGIVQRDGNRWRVRVSAKPVDGAANAAVIEMIATELGVAKNQVAIIRGRRSRDKVVQISMN